jgi:hypothetical protein
MFPQSARYSGGQYDHLRHNVHRFLALLHLDGLPHPLVSRGLTPGVWALRLQYFYCITVLLRVGLKKKKNVPETKRPKPPPRGKVSRSK